MTELKLRKVGPASMVRSCSAHNCIGLAHGGLMMCIPASNAPEAEPLQLPVPLFMCPLHFKLASAKDFITDEWKDQIIQVLHNRGAVGIPDFDKAWLEIVPFLSEPTTIEGETVDASVPSN